MKVLFIGGFFPEELFEDIRNNSYGPIANANNLFQWGIIDGLQSLNVLGKKYSFPQIGAYPSLYRSLFFKGNEAYDCGSFFNLIGFKHLDRYRRTKSFLRKQFVSMAEPRVVVVYDLNIAYLLSLVELKKEYSFHLCLVIPDLYGYTGGVNDILHQIWECYEYKLLCNTFLSVDSFVLLSEHMREKLPIGARPHVVVEGIFNPNRIRKNSGEDVKTLFYSGAVDERNGILNLLQAFALIDDAEYKLIICGDGSARTNVLEAARKDCRIDYRGQLSHEEVITLQMQSSLLVNPRTSEDDFTKYSFPSKTMEYFASGIPVLMYELDGIPREYYQYCFSLQDNSVNTLFQKIIEIHHMDFEWRKQMAAEAKKFILNEKNPRTQILKLINMIKINTDETVSN